MALLGIINPFRLEDEYSDEDLRRRAIRNRILTLIKITIFLIVWTFFTTFMIITPPHSPTEKLVALSSNKTQLVEFDEEPTGEFVIMELKGNIDTSKTASPKQASDDDPYIEINLESVDTNSNETLWKSKTWCVYIDVPELYSTATVKHSFRVDRERKRFMQRSLRSSDDSDIKMHVSLLNLHTESTGVSMKIDANPVDSTTGVILGVLLILFLYVLIAFEITDRAFAGVLVSLTAIGILCVMGMRPSFQTILSWIDINTLMLLFGMMIMVAILSDTGLFDYLSLFAYRMSKGNTWLLLFYLYMSTGILSAFLDNVTMVLMMVPVTIRLCEAVGLKTTLVVINIVLFSNIGGALTPVGDPPNMIIATNSFIVANGVDFGNFTLHMFTGVFFSMLLGFPMTYLMTRNHIFIGRADQLRRSIAGLEKLSKGLKEENREITKRIAELQERLKQTEAKTNTPNKDFDDNLNDMKMKYKIRDKILLIKCCIAFGFAVTMFLAHSFPNMEGITLCWAAVLAALLLLILTDRPDVDKVLEGVEWDTLIFFAALFVLTEALVEIGLIDWVSKQTIAVIMLADKDSRLCVSILLLLWISAITSAFVGNIPITQMMLKLTINLATNDKLGLPLHPLVWAISFGCCFGGNGTLIGASANVVTAGMANSFGYNINFKYFFILGFPLMILSCVIATIYLLIVHCVLTWH
ncbi:hypothetical protein ACLKA7_002901 [Drosophila subpalustris]